MQRKTPLCRDFQRGSCQFGERCKYIHATQHQSRSNASGSGTPTASNQQQTHNPFGFGVQNNSQSKGTTEVGSRQNQFKPFENKWTRPSNGGTTSARQSDSQPQAANHKCTDPEVCKRVISEDFEHERPLWKLTCYGHWKNAPCDIVGDVSYEELRAAAYDDAKRGLSMQSIVERERNLLSSRLIEFENLLRNPYASRPNSTLASQSPFFGTSPNASSVTPQNSAPPSVSSFSQLGASLNTRFGTRPSEPSVNAFGQSNSFANSNQTSVWGNSSHFGNSASFGSQPPIQSLGNSFTSNISGFGNSGITSAKSNLLSTSAVSTQLPSSSINQSPVISSRPNSVSNANGQPTSIQLVNNEQTKNVYGDASIWLKEKWIPGEIPEEAPPDAYVF